MGQTGAKEPVHRLQQEDPIQQLKNVTLRGVLPLDEELGRGAYGCVFTVKYRGIVRAAKRIHPNLIENVSNEEKQRITDDFIRECLCCSSIQHPNVVEFVGVYYPPQCSFPVMVMELMSTSLTKFVKDNKSKITFSQKISLLHDVTVGLNFLHNHKPQILHRDLSSNNVMLTKQLVAKIGDLGVAKVVQADNRQTKSKLTRAPGTLHFMPPEALVEKSPVYYDTSIDVFSFGGIALHVFSEEWPAPSAPKTRDPITKKLVALSEAERRQQYLDKMTGKAAKLKKIVEQCLDDEHEERPPIHEVSTVIGSFKYPIPELKDVTMKEVTHLDIELGRGSYGIVFTVKYSGNVYAAKQIHPILIENVSSEGKQKITDDFVRECLCCSSIQHPNIVQFVGVYYPSAQCSFPVMVMELMSASLTKFVEGNKSRIAIETKKHILHDVTVGLNFLHNHKPQILHRDLSPNNVMLNMHLVAKIGDLGVAKVVRADSKETKNKLTKAPGTLHFMPPETLEDNPVYSTPIDVFSFGGVALFVFSEEWPTPSDPKVKDPITKKLVALSEAERRQQYLDKMTGKAAKLRKMIEQCLDDDPAKRPPIHEVSTVIESFEPTDYPPYSSAPYHPGKPRDIPAQPNPYDKFCVGSVVYYDKNPNCTGVIKMIYGNMAGIEMDVPFTGGTNGTYNGVRLFDASPGKGLYTALEHLCLCTPQVKKKPNPFKLSHNLCDPTAGVHFVQAPEELNVALHTGVKGIQGNQNSCYIDATLYGMFAFSNAFDTIILENKHVGYRELNVKNILEQKIVNPLRKVHAVVQDAVVEFREKLSALNKMKGLTSDEKDPEEFLNFLFKHVLHVEPFLHINRPSGADKEFFIQLFVGPDKNVPMPDTHWLLHKMFKDEKITFKECPQKLLLQIPCFGKHFRSFERVKPTLRLDVSALCDDYAGSCFVCDAPGEKLCTECSQEKNIIGASVYFCDECSMLWHTHPDRQSHNLVIKSNVADTYPLELLSVLCIEYSQYVCFTRITGSGKDQWVFFDSMAGRTDEYCLPRVTHCTDEINEWVYGDKDISKIPLKQLPELVRRYVGDPYLCIYTEFGGSLY